MSEIYSLEEIKELQAAYKKASTHVKNSDQIPVYPIKSNLLNTI
jgi:hypothetical protein